jgi:hypothetical protein
MIHIKDLTLDSQKLIDLFEEIRNGNTILFLGAGASVTDEKKYLSSQLIKYYRDIQNISYDTNDIVDFVDKIFSSPKYQRSDFDSKISTFLRKLNIQDYHKILTDIPWNSVLTTNVDLLIENAFEKEGKLEALNVIRNKQELLTPKLSNDLKYIKLHGCISDLGKYPIAFSSKDFEECKKYHKHIFKTIIQASYRVKIIFIGYSFKDEFGKRFLDYATQELGNREIYLIDPFLTDEFDVNFYWSKNINIVNAFTKNFFELYSSWFLTNNKIIVDRKHNIFNLHDSFKINSYLQHQLSPFLLPLNESYFQQEISSKEYYLGFEPDYGIVNKNYDIIKEKKLKDTIEFIEQKFENQGDLYPLIFLKGSYGTGKTTFTYRVIKELTGNDSNILAFHLTDLKKYSEAFINQLIISLKGLKKLIFFSDHSEIDSNFKAIRNIRGSLSSNQYPDKKIIFLQAIRENTLEKFKKFHNPDLIEYNIDNELNREELSKLVDKYYNDGLIKYKDAKEKSEILLQIKSLFGSNDQYLFLLKFIDNGNHKKSLLKTYNDLSEDMQKAFLYTSLSYRYGIPMPSGLLQKMLSLDWNNFITDVIKTEGFGILIQEKLKPDHYLLPDLYFKIKHPIIADILLNEKTKDSKQLFLLYRKLISCLETNEISSYVANNLLRSLGLEKTFDKSNINLLYDEAYKILSDFSHFCLSYSVNLQHRNTEKDLLFALKIVNDLDEYKDNSFSRNSRIVHRKAVLNRELSKYYHKDSEIDKSKDYFDEALDLFEVKLSLDPTTIHSYKDLIGMLISTLKNWEGKLSDIEKVKIEIRIKELFTKAKINLQEGLNNISRLETQFVKLIGDVAVIKERMDNLMESTDTKPYALLLKYELFQTKPNLLIPIPEESEIIEELSNYDYCFEVAKFLFSYYGERLNMYNYRIKFFKLVKDNKSLIDYEKLDYYFYSFIANALSHMMQDAWDSINSIRKEFPYSVYKKKYYWLEQDSNLTREFTGKVVKNGNDYLMLKINEMGGNLKTKINMRKYQNLDFTKTYKANLYFTFTGIWAEIIE